MSRRIFKSRHLNLPSNIGRVFIARGQSYENQILTQQANETKLCAIVPRGQKRGERAGGCGAAAPAFFGGPGRDRTDDLFHAMEARSQTAPQAHCVAGATFLFSLGRLDSSMRGGTLCERLRHSRDNQGHSFRKAGVVFLKQLRAGCCRQRVEILVDPLLSRRQVVAGIRYAGS
jgi:hypothetical protein